jgi:hypothetical protein
MIILNGKTEGEHQAEKQRNTPSSKVSSSKKGDSKKKLSEKDIKQVKKR